MPTMTCPRCSEGEIEVDIVHASKGRSATFNRPAEGSEFEWVVKGRCPECNFSDVDARRHDWEQHVDDFVADRLAEEEEAAADIKADRAYDEWRDRD